MIAVIKTGGKQYIVAPNQKLRVEKLEAEVGQTVEFDQVLLKETADSIEVGNPVVKGAKVTAKVLQQAKADKVLVLKYKAKTRYNVKRGHRQMFTEVLIEEIK